jgi:hypothetical protein
MSPEEETCSWTIFTSVFGSLRAPALDPGRNCGSRCPSGAGRARHSKTPDPAEAGNRSAAELRHDHLCDDLANGALVGAAVLSEGDCGNGEEDGRHELHGELSSTWWLPVVLAAGILPSLPEQPQLQPGGQDDLPPAAIIAGTGHLQGTLQLVDVLRKRLSYLRRWRSKLHRAGRCIQSG